MSVGETAKEYSLAMMVGQGHFSLFQLEHEELDMVI